MVITSNTNIMVTFRRISVHDRAHTFNFSALILLNF